jgi:hypothetical protein
MTLLPGMAQRVTVAPRAIGPTGVVVGQGFDTGDEPREETAWYLENGTGGVLPTLDPTIELDNHAGALGVNRAGTIVGFSKTASGRTHAVLWRRPQSGPIAHRLSYSSWRRNQTVFPASLRPRGARSSHWYMPQSPSSPRS